MYQPRLSVVNHPTQVAVIGCGYWGMNYVRVLSELPDAEVDGVRRADRPTRRGGASLSRRQLTAGHRRGARD